MFRALAAALMFSMLGGCDRFADEERVLTVLVQDDEGRPLSNVEVHAVLHFNPAYARQTSLPATFSLDGLSGVTFDVTRRSDGASVSSDELGILGPGSHTVPPDLIDLPNGVYRLRVRANAQVLLETDFVLNRAPDAAGTQSPHARSVGGGQITLSPEALSLHTTAHLDRDGTTEAFEVTDSLTLWFVPPGGIPQSLGVRMNPIGPTRVVATLE